MLCNDRSYFASLDTAISIQNFQNLGSDLRDRPASHAERRDPVEGSEVKVDRRSTLRACESGCLLSTER